MKQSPKFAPMHYAQREAQAVHMSGKQGISKQSILRLLIALEHYVRFSTQRFSIATVCAMDNTVGLMLLIHDEDATRQADFQRLQTVVAVHPTLKIVEFERVQGKTLWQVTWDGCLLPNQMDLIANDLIKDAKADPNKSSSYEQAKFISEELQAVQDKFGTFPVELKCIPPVTIAGKVVEYMLFGLPGTLPA